MPEMSGGTQVEESIRAGLAEIVAAGPDPAKRQTAIDARTFEHGARAKSRRQFMAGAAATTVAAGVGAVWFVTRGDGRSPDEVTVGTAPSSSLPTAPDGWTQIAPAPLKARRSPHAVWVDEDLIVWGGVATSDPDYRVGASWNPVSGTWSRIAPAPAGDIGGGFAVWNGNEVFVGPTEIDSTAPWNEGATESDMLYGIAAFDPAADRWRYVAPVLPDGDQLTVTSARQAVLASDGSLLVAPRAARPAGGRTGRDLVRVDVASGELRTLEAGPFAASPYSDASGTVALAVVGDLVVATPNWDLRPWVLDLLTGTWTRAEAPPGAASLHLLPATPVGAEVIFIESDGPPRFWAFDPTSDGSDGWRAMPPNPYEPAVWRYEPVWSGTEYFVPGAAYDPETDDWREVEPPPRGRDRQRTLQAMWAGGSLLLFGGEEYDCPGGAICDRNPGPDSLDGWMRADP